MSRLDRVKRNYEIRKAKGQISGAVEGTTRDWEDVYANGRVTRVETTRDGDWFGEEDVTEEYED